MSNFVSLFGRIPNDWLDGVHSDDVVAGTPGYVVDPLAFFCRDYKAPYDEEVTFYEGMRRPITVVDVQRLKSGWISALRVRDEVNGKEVRCRRLSAKVREGLVRRALPPGNSITKYQMRDVMWTSTSACYFAEVIGFISSSDETCGFALPARIDGVDVKQWERALSILPGLMTAQSRRVARHTDWRMGVFRAVRLGTRGEGDFRAAEVTSG